jgi:hypothetical protein
MPSYKEIMSRMPLELQKKERRGTDNIYNNKLQEENRKYTSVENLDPNSPLIKYNYRGGKKSKRRNTRLRKTKVRKTKKLRKTKKHNKK